MYSNILIYFFAIILIYFIIKNVNYEKYKYKEHINLENKNCCQISIKNKDDKFYYNFIKKKYNLNNNISNLGVVEYFYHGINGWNNNFCDKNYKINIDNKKLNSVGSCRYNNQNCVDFVTPKMCKKMNKTNNFIFSEKPCKEKICLPVEI